VTALVVDGGMIPMMNGSEEVVYDVQKRTAASNPWSVMTIASRGDDEVRLEATTASVVVEDLDSLRLSARYWH
jgi:hypothetical protein